MRLEKGWGEVGEMGRVGRKGGKDVGINGEEGVDIKGRLRDRGWSSFYIFSTAPIN